MSQNTEILFNDANFIDNHSYKYYNNFGNIYEDVDMMGFTLDIQGQLNSIKLSKNHCYLALFETVVNAIQSIEDSINSENGEINIYAYRDNENQLTFDDLDGEGHKLLPFNAFKVVDNGKGFSDENYQSFTTAYSQLKVSKGCKGIGRFTWLKTFDEIEIKSNFNKHDNEWYSREFKFTPKGIEPEENLSNSEHSEYRTEVILNGIKHNFKCEMTKDIDLLANKIIEHCLLYFVRSNKKCPNIFLHDVAERKKVDLNKIYEENIFDKLNRDSVTIGDEAFELIHLRLPYTKNSKNSLHLCADSRDVYSIKLENYVPNLASKLHDDDLDKDFFYAGYLLGDYLDKTVNSSRTGFNFKSHKTSYIDDHMLVNGVSDFIKLYLADELEVIKTEKRNFIDNYVRNSNPKYRVVLNNYPEIFERIKPNCKEDELELELHREVQKIEHDVKKRANEIEEKIRKNDLNNIEEIIEKYQEQIKDLNRISLSDYIIKRRAILDVLDKSLRYVDDENKKYVLESQIHNLIFPMGKTSDDIDYSMHNLWVIDEKLSYHYYLASDKKLSSLPIIKNDSKNEPDIIIFNSPFAFTNEDEQPFRNISIIEFKRPGRNEYNSNDNPIQQVIEYMEDIISGKIKTKDGMTIDGGRDLRFFCYIICDETDKIKSYAVRQDMKQCPDGIGYFTFLENYKAYMEIIPYKKLIQDSKKRNKILFDKLFEFNMDK